MKASSQSTKCKVQKAECRLGVSAVVVALSCLALLGLASGAEVKVSGSAGTVKVSAIRRVELDYYLVTKDKPLDFTVAGPNWLRVYTRLWLPQKADSNYVYRVSLWQDEVERPLQFKAQRSSSSWGPAEQPVGRWRSFYVQVPAGQASYRLSLTDAPSSTVGVRFSFEKPPAWQPVAVPGLKELSLVQAGNRERLFELASGSPTQVKVRGPCRVRVRMRLNYSPEMQGAQNFVLTISKQGKPLAGKNFRVNRSATATYENLADAVPSTETVLKFTLPEGEHQLLITLSGTLARSAGVILETIAAEKYE